MDFECFDQNYFHINDTIFILGSLQELSLNVSKESIFNDLWSMSNPWSLHLTNKNMEEGGEVRVKWGERKGKKGMIKGLLCAKPGSGHITCAGCQGE